MKVYVLTNRASEIVGIFASWQGASEEAKERQANISEHDLEWSVDDGVTQIRVTCGCVLELLEEPGTPLVHVDSIDVPGGVLRFRIL